MTRLFVIGLLLCTAAVATAYTSGAFDVSTASGTLAVANGGTGATTLTGALVGNGTGAVTAGTLSVANGGTGAATHTANGALLGAGTGAFTTLAPGTDGNVMTASGGIWTSAAAGSTRPSRAFGQWRVLDAADTNFMGTGLNSPTIADADNVCAAAGLAGPSGAIVQTCIMATGATTGNVARAYDAGFNTAQARAQPYWRVIVRTDNNTTMRKWVALAESTLSGIDSSTSVHYYGLRFSTGVPDTNWQCCSGSGAAQGCTDTGVVPATSVAGQALSLSVGLASLICCVDTTCVTHTTPLDATGPTQLGPEISVTTLDNVAVTWRVGNSYAEIY